MQYCKTIILQLKIKFYKRTLELFGISVHFMGNKKKNLTQTDLMTLRPNRKPDIRNMSLPESSAVSFIMFLIVLLFKVMIFNYTINEKFYRLI